MATPSPTDPPRGGEVWARRTRAHNDVHLPRMLALWRRGMTHREIAAELNTDSKNARGLPWNHNLVQRVLVDRTDPAEYAALVRVGMARSRASRPRTHDAAALPRAIDLLKAGLTYDGIAERLRAEGYVKRGKSPWGGRLVSNLLRRHFTPAELAALRPGGKTRALSDRQRSAEEFEGAIVARIVEACGSGPTLPQVARQLNAEGIKTALNREWKPASLRDCLKRRLPPDEYAALARASQRAGFATAIAILVGRTRRHDETMLPRILELRGEGLSQEKVALRLNEEAGGDIARLNGVGLPWTMSNVSALLARSHGGAAPGHRHGRRAAAATARSTTMTTTTEDGPAAVAPVLAAAADAPQVILGETTVRVLGVDGRYREKPLGGGANSKVRRKVIEALLKAGAEKGLGNTELQKVTGGARAVIGTFRKDRDWAAVLYPPDKARGLGWRFGPPQSING